MHIIIIIIIILLCVNNWIVSVLWFGDQILIFFSNILTGVKIFFVPRNKYYCIILYFKCIY